MNNYIYDFGNILKPNSSHHKNMCGFVISEIGNYSKIFYIGLYLFHFRKLEMAHVHFVLILLILVESSFAGNNILFKFLPFYPPVRPV